MLKFGQTEITDLNCLVVFFSFFFFYFNENVFSCRVLTNEQINKVSRSFSSEFAPAYNIWLKC